MREGRGLAEETRCERRGCSWAARRGCHLTWQIPGPAPVAVGSGQALRGLAETKGYPPFPVFRNDRPPRGGRGALFRLWRLVGGPQGLGTVLARHRRLQYN